MKYRKRRLLLKRKHIIIVGALLVAIIAAIVIVRVSGGARERTAERQAVQAQLQTGLLRIGLRGDLSSLCTYNADTGEYEGLEKDIVDELVSRVFGNDIIVEFVDVNSRTKDALLKIGDIDLSLGASINTDESGICCTSSYFADGCGFLVMDDGSEAQETREAREELKDGIVAVVQNSLPAMESRENEDITKLEYYLAAQDIAATIKMYASYPEAVDALSAGLVNGVCASETDLKIFGKSGMLLLGERFIPNRYCVQFSDSDSALCAVFNKAIAAMREDGTLSALTKKWNLKDYSGLNDL